MPTLADFDAAVLQIGRPFRRVTAWVGTIALRLRQPWRVVGRTAVVYQLNQPSGGALALRCPLGIRPWPTPASGSATGRWRPIPRSRPSVSGGPLVSGLVYFPSGLSLPAGEFRSASHPVMVMEWTKGPTLLAAVDRACREEDTATLEALVEAWAAAMTRLAKAGVYPRRSRGRQRHAAAQRRPHPRRLRHL